MTEDQKQKVVVIVGPTASGKTALAIELAKRFDGEVISADSRQVYRGLDIGTEKVTKEEMDGVPHHLIDIVEPTETYSAADFKRDAKGVIADIARRGRLPIVAGGTFFYVDALLGTAPLPEVPPDPELRAELEQQTTAALFGALQQLDPNRAATIEPHNKRRLVRALEIVRTLGRVPRPGPSHEDYDALLLGIRVPKDELRTRIRARGASAIERGLVTETESLLENGVPRERLEEIGLEYPLALQYIDGNLSEAELLQKIEEKNWQYAKRQLTWLARMEHIHWIDWNNSDAAIAVVREFLTADV